MDIIPRKLPKGQATKVLNHLKNCGSLTSWEAFEVYHITRLSAVIKVLRSLGYPITSTVETSNGSHYSRYEIKEEEN